MRIDKWLWAARFFKTRPLAVKACELGRIEAAGQRAKPAREVRVGEMLRIRNEAGEFTVEVLGLSEMRGPAASAQALYAETEESRKARALAEDERIRMLAAGGAHEKRPSSRDRQATGRIRGRF
jgi:ribosome-associated heat shock protein Hsp15